MPTAPSPVIPPASGSTPDTPTAIVPLPTGTPIAPGGITPAPSGSVSAPGSVVGTPDATPDVPASIVEVATSTPTAPGSITPLPGGSAAAPGSIVGAPDAMPDAPAPIVEVASGTPAPPEPASAAPIERSYPAGPPGLSAYEVAVQNGFEGTEEEWLASLAGAGSVRYDATQSLTTEQKTQGRANIDAAASSHTHSGAEPSQWVEGSMHNAVTASLGGSTDWLWVPETDPTRIINAIDSQIGTGWQSGGGGSFDSSFVSYWDRPYWVNKAYMDNSPNVSISFMTYISATVIYSIGSSEGFPDGVQIIDFTGLGVALSSNYGSFPIPASVQMVYWSGSGTEFSMILQSLETCPWITSLGGKIFDFAGGDYGTETDYVLPDNLQNVLENLFNAGNTVVFPESNALNDAWLEVPSYPSFLTCTNLVTYDIVCVTRGNGVTEGLTEDQIYVAPAGFESSNEFVLANTEYQFPRRHAHDNGFYHVIVPGSPSAYYIAARPDFVVNT